MRNEYRERTMVAIRSSVVKNENRIPFSFHRINQRTFMHRLYDFCIARHAYCPPFYTRPRRNVDISALVSEPVAAIFVGYLNFDISMNFLARHE